MYVSETSSCKFTYPNDNDGANCTRSNDDNADNTRTHSSTIFTVENKTCKRFAFDGEKRSDPRRVKNGGKSGLRRFIWA